ncbi:MAG: hypothetical protein SGARI_004152, partial [Bacillariaceae sp.]
MFFQSLIVTASYRLVKKPRRCGALESKLALVFLIIATIITIVGGIVGALGVTTDMILDMGRISWQVAFLTFFFIGGKVWAALAREQTVKIWGLPNSYAGKLLMASLFLTCIAWIVEVAWKDTFGSAFFVLVAYFGILMMVFFTHNVILTVICPFEIFVEDDEMSQTMSEYMQARDIATTLRKPGPSTDQKLKLNGKLHGDVHDTDSSS